MSDTAPDTETLIIDTVVETLLEEALDILEEYPRERPPRLEAARQKLLEAIQVSKGV